MKTARETGKQLVKPDLTEKLPELREKNVARALPESGVFPCPPQGVSKEVQPAFLDESAGAGTGWTGWNGSVRRKVEPLPGSESTPISPW